MAWQTTNGKNQRVHYHDYPNGARAFLVPQWHANGKFAGYVINIFKQTAKRLQQRVSRLDSTIREADDAIKYADKHAPRWVDITKKADTSTNSPLSFFPLV